MDAFFTITSAVPASEPVVDITAELVDHEGTGSSSSHSSCTIA